MYEVLLAKANSCKKFKTALLNTNKDIIVEGTSDPFWGCAVSPPYSETCSVKFMRGQNALGFTLMDLRKDLLSTKSIIATVSHEAMEIAHVDSDHGSSGSVHHSPASIHNINTSQHTTVNASPDCGSETFIVVADVHKSAVTQPTPSPVINNDPTTENHTQLEVSSLIPLPDDDSFNDNTLALNPVSTSKPDATPSTSGISPTEFTSGASRTVSTSGAPTTITQIKLSNKPMIRVKCSIPRRRSKGSISSIKSVTPVRRTLDSFFNVITAVRQKVSPEKSSDVSNKCSKRHESSKLL